MKTRKYMKNNRPGPKPGADKPAVNTDNLVPQEDYLAAEEPEPVTAAEELAGEEVTAETPAAAEEHTEASEPVRRPYWIHDQILDPDYPDGVKVLPGCTCSECGFKVSFERDKCPHCGAVMRPES
ncbi:MAG: hypothetical protein IJH44_05645 [Solobacterium sp.]|nr:hypothetical protein [Solobacterium sp.]MBR0215231.1 hypothetical protein [Solobacterium sp.]